ncbi:MAG: hypothetical protein E7675_07470 [Ruminococcaceae bacterium]|nr:hypothetical protein [Oscillospiraceae bacterium]
MKAVIQHEVYGQIEYTESFWTGKKTLTINGTPAQLVSKKEFNFGGKTVSIKGSYYSGTSLEIDGQIIEVFQKPQWYEVVLAFLPFAFLLVWGNSTVLCSIFPVIGGALGGALGGLAGCISLMFMKNTKSAIGKVFVGLGVGVVTILIAFVLALALLSVVA